MWFINIHNNHNAETDYRVFNSENDVLGSGVLTKKGFEEAIAKHNIKNAVVVINGFGIYQSKKTLANKDNHFFVQKYSAFNQEVYAAIKMKDALEILMMLSNLGVSTTNVFVGDGLGMRMLTSDVSEAFFGDTAFSILYNEEIKINKSAFDNREYIRRFSICLNQFSNEYLISNDHFVGIPFRVMIALFNVVTSIWRNSKWIIGAMVVLIVLICSANYGYESMLDKNQRATELKVQEKGIEHDNMLKYQSIIRNLKRYNVSRAKYLSVLLNDLFNKIPKGIEVTSIDAFPELKSPKEQSEANIFSNSITIEGKYEDFVEFEKWGANVNTLLYVKQVVYNDFKKVKEDNNFSISIVLKKNVK